LTSAGILETKGLEPSTFALRTRRPPTEGTQSQQVTSTPEAACTNACTNSAESEHAGSSDGAGTGGLKGVRTDGSDADAADGAEAGSGAGSLGASSLVGGDAGAAAFADVLRMLDRLPLSNAEKAEAVRRLLADQNAEGSHDGRPQRPRRGTQSRPTAFESSPQPKRSNG